MLIFRWGTSCGCGGPEAHAYGHHGDHPSETQSHQVIHVTPQTRRHQHTSVTAHDSGNGDGPAHASNCSNTLSCQDIMNGNFNSNSCTLNGCRVTSSPLTM